jgi:hypothetical protein
MPYKREGKCIINAETGKNMGCSTTVGKAKAHMRALYAAEKGSIKEESSKMTQAILDRAEDIYQAMKKTASRNAIKRYGADAEDVLRGRAMNIAKKQVKMGNEDKLKEIIKKKLSTPPSKGIDEKKSFPDLTGDGKVTKADILKGRGVELKEEADYEGEMAKSELFRMIENAEELMGLLNDDTQLEAWVQSKITKAADYLASVTQYLKYQSVKPQVDEREELYHLDK